MVGFHLHIGAAAVLGGGRHLVYVTSRSENDEIFSLDFRVESPSDPDGLTLPWMTRAGACDLLDGSHLGDLMGPFWPQQRIRTTEESETTRPDKRRGLGMNRG